MSIYLPGMEMPKNCHSCWFAWCVYNLTGTGQRQPGGRVEDCPLIPVPEHGRLIEDTAVREQIDEWLDSVGDVVVGHGLSYYGELVGCIEDAPTIIPASGGKENE